MDQTYFGVVFPRIFSCCSGLAGSVSSSNFPQRSFQCLRSLQVQFEAGLSHETLLFGENHVAILQAWPCAICCWLFFIEAGFGHLNSCCFADPGRLFRMIALVNHTLECLKGSWRDSKTADLHVSCPITRYLSSINNNSKMWRFPRI